MEFLFKLLVLFLLAKVIGELLHHFGSSALVGEVLVGVVLGPAVLGWFAPDQYIEAVAMLGLVVLMLVAGLNSRFDMLWRVKFKALAIAVGGMGASFALGFSVAYAWGYSLIACLFVAVALSSTATEVIARVTERSRLNQLLVGAALVDDVLAVYILGVLSAAVLAGGISFSVLLWATAGVLAFFLAVGYLSHKLVVELDLMRKLWRLEHRGAPLTFALVLALALAVVAQRAGLHAIIGAYMAGLFIGRLRERPDALLLSRIRLNQVLDDIASSLRVVLTPLFFVYVGLRFAPAWEELKLTMLLTLIAAAFAGKLVGCGGVAAATGHGRKESLSIGVAMCSRGSLEMALLLFGLGAEIVPPDLYAAMVVTALSTTILTPILFKRVG